ncbi:uncharacterized protein UV8b_01515 [Ustilaginoidea virens]|uniref:Cyclin domain-containing protein n=1 Tax=Ustilaginoidea virens TaxID=1159556 RepID=A0A8E5HKV1_USTVR|nr:uncharacterized protein UV8b_01515 [Ustilaginoidea virens]QUC17274.1 hypothetical protein UV8b_01515 [Ustilaginoidea virens]
MAHLTNPLATPSQLSGKFSLSSLPQDLWESVFIATQCLTQAAGQLLDLPQSVTAQANVLLARYWLVDSPMAHEFSDVSAAAVYLVAKLGPLPRSPRDVSNVYSYLVSSRSVLFRPGHAPPACGPRPHLVSEPDYLAFQTRLLALEARILCCLGFNAHVALPHALAVTYLQTLDFLSQPRAAVSRRAVQYLNAALLSPQLLYLTHQPNLLATAAVYNAARDLGAKMPECEWYEVFDGDREELGFLVVGMRSLEGLMRRRKEDAPHLFDGMPTRSFVEEEMSKRGLRVGENGGAKGSQEDAVMRSMDHRSLGADK